MGKRKRHRLNLNGGPALASLRKRGRGKRGRETLIEREKEEGSQGFESKDPARAQKNLRRVGRKLGGQ